jgi:hypothetical protein
MHRSRPEAVLFVSCHLVSLVGGASRCVNVPRTV